MIQIFLLKILSRDQFPKKLECEQKNSGDVKLDDSCKTNTSQPSPFQLL